MQKIVTSPLKDFDRVIEVEDCVKSHYNYLLSNIKVVERYKCPYCGELEDGEFSIKEHLVKHAIDARISRLWKKGITLKELNDLYHVFHSYYPDVPSCYDSFLECHHNITKDSCFKISYLQCCDYPAYRIYDISCHGIIKVWGIGGWSGGYSSIVSLGNLREPRPLSELYIHPKFRK